VLLLSTASGVGNLKDNEVSLETTCGASSNPARAMQAGRVLQTPANFRDRRVLPESESLPVLRLSKMCPAKSGWLGFVRRRMPKARCHATNNRRFLRGVIRSKPSLRSASAFSNGRQGQKSLTPRRRVADISTSPGESASFAKKAIRGRSLVLDTLRQSIARKRPLHFPRGVRSRRFPG
jgi:hypothetical protein